MECIEYVIDRIEQRTQTQIDTHSQLLYLLSVANKLGLYDAADVIKNIIIKRGM